MNEVMIRDESGGSFPLALRNEHGEIKAIQDIVVLSSISGDLIQILGGPWIVSAKGYEKLAEAIGASMVFPDTLSFGGKKVSNPYLENDPKTGRTKRVYCRVVAFRYSNNGIPSVADWTTCYDLDFYRLQDLIAKAKKASDNAFKILPAGTSPNKNEPWAEYPIDGNISVWMNCSHQDAIHWLQQMVQREKKAVDTAQTFARRNAMKHLTGIQQLPDKSKHQRWEIPVVRWQPVSGDMVQWTGAQYVSVQKKADKVAAGQIAFTPSGDKANVDKGNEYIEETDVVDAEISTDEDVANVDTQESHDIGDVNVEQIESDPNGSEVQDDKNMEDDSTQGQTKKKFSYLLKQDLLDEAIKMVFPDRDKTSEFDEEEMKLIMETADSMDQF